MYKMDNNLPIIGDNFSDNDFGRICKELYLFLDEESRAVADDIGTDIEKFNVFLAQIHHSYGRFLRNEFHLWNSDNPIVLWSREKYGIDHADDISSIIIAGIIFNKDHEFRDLVIDTLVKRFHKHWRMYGN